MSVNTLLGCSTCGSGSSGANHPNGTNTLERMRFFPRQLITPADLTQDQIYFREKLRRHNRLLHGWGIVCGARVKAVDKCKVIVEPGYVLGPYGDEIMIDREVEVDLCKEDLEGNAVSPCGEGIDPWCTPVRLNRPANETLYLAIRYDECQARPTRVATGGCGCDLSECEYSRIRDSYAIKVLTVLPSTYSIDMQPPSPEIAIRCPPGELQCGPGCAACPSEPWVILADLKMNSDGDLVQLDCSLHRRYVATFSNFYYMCGRSQRRIRSNNSDTAGYTTREESKATLVDLSEAVEGKPPIANVPVRRTDGSWLNLPLYVEIDPGERYVDFIAREGDREFYDPASDETYKLREIMALAPIDPETKINGPEDTFAKLIGTRLRIDDYRVVRAALGETLNAAGISRMEKAHLGALSAAPELPAVSLRAVDTESQIGRKLADLSIGDVAGMSQQEFKAKMLKGVPSAQRGAVEEKAVEVWQKADSVRKLSSAWGEG